MRLQGEGVTVEIDRAMLMTPSTSEPGETWEHEVTIVIVRANGKAIVAIDPSLTWLTGVLGRLEAPKRPVV